MFRILLPRKTVLFYSAEGNNLRPPAADQVPAKRYLAYGTSITEGGAATRPYLSYVAQTARRLGADLINLGMSGACHCESAIVDHIAQRKDWDFATLCLSVNMIGAGFTAEEYRKRIIYAVDTISGADTSRPVACITILPYFVGLSSNHSAVEERAQLFRQILRDAVAACPHPNVHLIEGSELLDSTDCLSADMIHPSDYGMQRIAENLARRLKDLVR